MAVLGLTVSFDDLVEDPDGSRDAIAAVVRTQSRAAWLEILQDAGVPCAPQIPKDADMNHKFSALLASAFAAIVAAAPAHAAGSWVATKTLRHDDPAAVMQAAMKPGAAVHVALALQPRDRAGLDALVERLVAGRSAHHLTRAEFLAKHAPAAADVQAVVDHLARSGFTNVKVLQLKNYTKS